jgi:alpha/beta superfamily hydrolase
MIEALLERSIACLSFNFRGVGASQGTYSGGKHEGEDVLAALDFLEGLDMIDRSRILVGGFSFGCWIGLEAACKDSRASHLLGVSPPVNGHDLTFLSREERPSALIAGELDYDYCEAEKFQELMDSIPAPKLGVIVPGADHFHSGLEDLVAGEIGRFLDLFPLSQK